MNKLRLSYSLLSLWEKGDIDGAVQSYYHMREEINDRMKQGKEIHEDIAKHIDTYNTFPEYLNFKKELKMPHTEKEVVASYNELFDVKAIFDCYDHLEKMLYEFKTGTTDSLEWTRTYQLPFYFWVAELAKIPVETAILIRYNQYGKYSDYTIVHNSKRYRDMGQNMADSLGPDIYEFFRKEGLPFKK